MAEAQAIEIAGWDIGGAHVKLSTWHGGQLRAVREWPCALWTGLPALHAVLQQALREHPALVTCRHAVTMTGEMVDAFADREDGVRRITTLLAECLGPPEVFAGEHGFVRGVEAAARHWRAVASANWLATARHVAAAQPGRHGVLVDIGSTTTDLIAFAHGRVCARGRTDAQRLADGSLVYHGVVRTPLCALGPRIGWRGQALNVMNEWFATTADVYRLTGELDAAHDLHPSADGQAKDAPHTQARLARMIGLDARDGSGAEWHAFAHAWRARQIDELRGQLARVCRKHALGDGGTLVGAGCGAFLVDELVPHGWHGRRYAAWALPPTPPLRPGLGAWADVAAPAVAVAALWQRLPQAVASGAPLALREPVVQGH